VYWQIPDNLAVSDLSPEEGLSGSTGRRSALCPAGTTTGSWRRVEILSPRGQAAGLAHAPSRLPGVQGATAPAAASWRSGGTALLDVFTHNNTGAALASVRTAAHGFGPGVRVGGIDAQNRDFISAVYGSFPLMIALIAVLVFMLLARAFRSLLLAAKC
jgi:RND superfamily putative drug exporter